MSDPFDLANAEGVVANAACQLARGLLTAYRRNQTIFFYYKLREFLEDFGAEFPPARDLPAEQNILQLMHHLHRHLVKAADSKRSRLRVAESASARQRTESGNGLLSSWSENSLASERFSIECTHPREFGQIAVKHTLIIACRISTT